VPALPGSWTGAGAPTVPLQRSVVHTLPSSAHAVPEALTVSAGQSGPLPGQLSAMSHSLAAARQVRVESRKASAGEVAVLPVHAWAPSHPPEAAARQTVPELPGLWTHAGAPTVPLHWSVVHTLPSSVQVVPAAVTVSAGQIELEPVQLSATSHSLTAARQIAPALRGSWRRAGGPAGWLIFSVVASLPA